MRCWGGDGGRDAGEHDDHRGDQEPGALLLQPKPG
jgi:hypothetical protein